VTATDLAPADTPTDDADTLADDALAELFGTTSSTAPPLPPDGHIPDACVFAYMRVLEVSGVCDKVAAWLEEDRKATGPGGRPAVLSQKAVLVLLFILTHEHTPLLITRLVDVIEHRLSDHAKTLLGIPLAPATRTQWYHRIARTLHTLLDVIDPYPGPRNRLLTKVEHAALLASRCPQTAERKLARLDQVCNHIIESSIQVQPRRLRRRWKGNACVDATLVRAFGKRGTTKRSDYVSIEYDAAWYVRDGDHRDPGDAKRRTIQKVHHGWEAVLVTQVTNAPECDTDFPLLLVGMTFGKPGHDVAGTARRTFASIRERHHPAGYAMGDRAYFPNSTAEGLALPLRALGYKLVFERRDDQLGITASFAGAIQVEGNWFCPSMPIPLVEATLDLRVRKTIDVATWKQRIAQRTKYLLKPTERTDADGHTPMRCPAVGKSATVDCALRPGTVGVAAGGRPMITLTPTHPGRICINRSSVSFPPTAGAKYAQDLQFGTDEASSLFSSGRNTIEGANAYLKDPNFHALDDSGRRRIRGFAAQYLLVAFLVAAANIRKITTFVANERTETTTTPKVTTSRRRDRLNSFFPTTSPTSADPPAA
jgi:hypothetical protein